MKNLSLLPATDLTWVDGITGELLTWSKEGGAVKLNSASLGSAIQSVWDFFSGEFVQETVVSLGDNRLVTVNSSGIVKTLADLPGSDRYGWFVEGYLLDATKALFYFDGYNTPQVYTGGATCRAIDKPAADWTGTKQPHMAFQHKFHMCAMGGERPHFLYMSSPRTHEHFSSDIGDTKILNIHPGEGQRLVGGLTFRERAYVAKYPRGIWFVDDSSHNIEEWETPIVTNAIGLAGPGCWCATEEDIIILGSEGYFYALSRVRSNDQEELPPLFGIEISDFLRNQINLQRLDLVRSYYYGRKKQLIFCLPGPSSTVNNRKLIIDFNLPGKPRLFWSSRDICIALTSQRNDHLEEVLTGDDEGFIWRMDQTTKSKDGQGYLSQFEYGSSPILEKALEQANLRELQVVFAPAGNWDVTYEIHTDGSLSQVVQVSQQTVGGAVGSFSLDGDILAGLTIQNDRQRLIGSCNYFKLLGKNDQAGQDFNVVDHIVRYKPGRF